MKLWKSLTQPQQRKAATIAPLIAYNKVGAPVWTPRRYDRLAEEGYARNVIVYRCVSEIAQSIGALQLLVQENGAEMSTHPLLTLLQLPNPQHSRAGLLEALVSQILLAGNAYCELVPDSQGQPAELWPLRADRMTVIAGRHGVPQAYEYQVNGQRKRWAVDALTGASAILHLKRFHPLHDWYGLSPLEAAAHAVDQYNAASAWNQALLQNGCRPSGALAVEAGKDHSGTLSEEQFQHLKEQLHEQYSGARNAGRPMLLEGGVKWIDMMLSPKDMDFTTMKNTAAREIALAFGYPPMLLGIPGDNTYSNQREARLALWEQTILPLANNILESISKWLAPVYGAQVRLLYDEDAISALHPRRDLLWQRINAATFLSDAEKRIAVGYAANEAQ